MNQLRIILKTHTFPIKHQKVTPFQSGLRANEHSRRSLQGPDIAGPSYPIILLFLFEQKTSLISTNKSCRCVGIREKLNRNKIFPLTLNRSHQLIHFHHHPPPIAKNIVSFHGVAGPSERHPFGKKLLNVLKFFLPLGLLKKAHRKGLRMDMKDVRSFLVPGQIV